MNALAVYNGELVAGGRFLTAGGDPYGGMVRWNGCTWRSLGSEIEAHYPLFPDGPQVYALTVVAEGLVVGGHFSGAGDQISCFWARWSSEPPTIVQHPEPQVAYAGETVQFSATGSGVGPLHYAWAKDSVALSDGPTGSGSIITGALTDTLMITNVQPDDAGGYEAVVWSECGSGYSMAANLTVLGGACCFSDGACIVVGEPECLVASGVYQGEGTACDPNPCPQPADGACCLADGTCQIATEMDCGAMAGRYQGDETICQPNPCEPQAACCLGPGLCEMFTAAECEQAGGRPQAYPSPCEDHLCDCLWFGVPGGVQFDGAVSSLITWDPDGAERRRCCWWSGAGSRQRGGGPGNYIAGWDGAAWREFGSGMDGYVYALTVFNGDLVAAGTFTTAGGQACDYIARWDGGSWQPLGLGLDYDVTALTLYNDELIAGGYFSAAGGAPANRVAAWDGSVWRPLSSGMDGGVEVLAVYDEELVAGGWFTIAGGTSCD